MATRKITAILCTCERCTNGKHEWIKLGELSKRCPKCKSPYWNVAKRIKKGE